MKLAKDGGAGDGWAYMPDDQPRVCALCGGRITLKQVVWFRTGPLDRQTWHFSCK